jgi:hypothetical protein
MNNRKGESPTPFLCWKPKAESEDGKSGPTYLPGSIFQGLPPTQKPYFQNTETILNFLDFFIKILVMYL